MIRKWQFVLWTGVKMAVHSCVCPSPVTACGHVPVCPALHLFMLSSDMPHCRVHLLKRLISNSRNFCSQSPYFQLRPCFMYSINFYFCCAECGMSSINSGFECLCLSWGTILWYLQILNVGFSWLSTLVPTFSASSCAIAWELLLPLPVSLSSTLSPLCSTATLWNCEQEENLPPIAVSFRFSWHKTRKVIYLPWSRSFCQYPQYPSHSWPLAFLPRLLFLLLVLVYKPDLLLTTRLCKYSVPSFLFFYH